MKKLLLLLIATFIVVGAAKAQAYQIYTNGVPAWGSTNVVVDQSIYDTAVIHPPNWMAGPWNFTDPSGNPHNGYTTMRITSQQEGVWTVISGVWPNDQITINIQFENLTGIEEPNIYLNPTTGTINVPIDGKTNVFDCNGRLIIKAENAKNINLGPYRQGIYTIQLTTKTGVYTKKVIKN
jgi:hypothetical protein